MQRNLRGGRIEISRTSQKVQSYLFIFFPSVDERLFSIIRPEMASPINAHYLSSPDFLPVRNHDAAMIRPRALPL